MPAASTTKKQHTGAVFIDAVDSSGLEPLASSMPWKRSTG